MRIGLIGVGRVGVALSTALAAKGVAIAAVYNRTTAPAQQLALTLGITVAGDLIELVKACDVILLTVADDAIAPVAQQLATLPVHGKTVIHTSGVHSLGVLQPLADAGAHAASIHPVIPFADPHQAAQALIGAVFAVEYENDLTHDIIHGLIQTLNGRMLHVPPGKKSVYHAALCICSNYTVTLYAVARQLLLDMAIDTESAEQALSTLLSATVDNIVSVGVPAALTGPLVRGDVGTVAAHLAGLKDVEAREMYVVLARATFPMLMQRSVDVSALDDTLRTGDD